jgi:hypothetical protein
VVGLRLFHFWLGSCSGQLRVFPLIFVNKHQQASASHEPPHWKKEVHKCRTLHIGGFYARMCLLMVGRASSLGASVSVASLQVERPGEADELLMQCIAGWNLMVFLRVEECLDFFQLMTALSCSILILDKNQLVMIIFYSSILNLIPLFVNFIKSYCGVVALS